MTVGRVRDGFGESVPFQGARSSTSAGVVFTALLMLCWNRLFLLGTLNGQMDLNTNAEVKDRCIHRLLFSQ